MNRATPQGCCKIITAKKPTHGIEFELHYGGVSSAYEFWSNPDRPNDVIHFQWTENRWWITGGGIGATNPFYTYVDSNDVCPHLGNDWNGSWETSCKVTWSTQPPSTTLTSVVTTPVVTTSVATTPVVTTPVVTTTTSATTKFITGENTTPTIVTTTSFDEE